MTTTGNVFAPFDFDLIKAFVVRESLMYTWRVPEGREEWVDKIYNQLVSYRVKNPEVDYIHIHSLSNLGIIISTLTLSGNHYSSERKLDINMPPSPFGNLNFTWSKGDKYV